MIYTPDRVHASGPTDRSTNRPTLFVGPTVPYTSTLSSITSLSLSLPSSIPARTYVGTCTRAHSRARSHTTGQAGMCDGGAAMATANRQQHNAANTGTDKIGIRTAMSRTPAGTHAFFARNLPTVVRTYIYPLSFHLGLFFFILLLFLYTTWLVVIIRTNEGSPFA